MKKPYQAFALALLPLLASCSFTQELSSEEGFRRLNEIANNIETGNFVMPTRYSLSIEDADEENTYREDHIVGLSDRYYHVRRQRNVNGTTLRSDTYEYILEENGVLYFYSAYTANTVDMESESQTTKIYSVTSIDEEDYLNEGQIMFDEALETASTLLDDEDLTYRDSPFGGYFEVTSPEATYRFSNSLLTYLETEESISTYVYGSADIVLPIYDDTWTNIGGTTYAQR